MPNTIHEIYRSDGPYMEGAIRVSGRKKTDGGHSSDSPAGSDNFLLVPGMRNHRPEQNLLEGATLGSMPVVNQLKVQMNSDGTAGISIEVADATPETGPGVSRSGNLTSTSAPSTSAVGVQTGWVQFGNGYKYYKEDGSGYKTGWHSENQTDGSKAWYYFDEDPNNKEWMVTGWKKIKGAHGEFWYYFRIDGKMSICWELLNGMWYYLDPVNDNGNMILGWKMINSNWYYFIPEEDAGYMMLDWLEVKEKWYYFYNSDDNRGIMAANHMVNHTDGKQYYLGSDGAMVVSITFKSEEDGRTYTADENGVCSDTGSSIEKDLEEILIANGYSNAKAHTMAKAYEACEQAGYERNFGIGMMANIFHEGSAGKLEGKSSARYWNQAPQNILNLAGKTITNANMARTWLNDTPRVSGFGVGSIQWSYPTRRDSILNAYLRSAQTWSSDELSEIEVLFMIRELQGIDYKDYIKIVPDCIGKSVEFCAEQICRRYECPSKMEENVDNRRRQATLLSGILSNYGY